MKMLYLFMSTFFITVSATQFNERNNGQSCQSVIFSGRKDLNPNNIEDLRLFLVDPNISVTLHPDGSFLVLNRGELMNNAVLFTQDLKSWEKCSFPDKSEWNVIRASVHNTQAKESGIL